MTLYPEVKCRCTPVAQDSQMETIGERIKKAREASGLTQVDIAKRLGVSKAAVSNWEKERNFPDLPSFMELCGLLKVSSDYILWARKVDQYKPEVLELAKRISELDEKKRELLVSIFSAQR